jgi:hypothetical protein
MEQHPAKVKRRTPVLLASRASEFETAAAAFLSQQLRASLEHIVSAENSLHLHHGGSWGMDTGLGPGELKSNSAEAEIPFDALCRNEVRAFASYFTTLISAMSAAMQKEMYSTVAATAENVGNTVSQKDTGSFAQAFLEMLKKIEFGVDSRGEVSMPAIHVAPEMGKKLLAELQSQGPAYEAEVERIKQEKIKAALARETERLGKYKQ